MIYSSKILWKNKKGTSERSCKCGSWKKHWENFSGIPFPIFCSVKDCNNDATLGAHIIGLDSKKEYIVPVCDSCNKSKNLFVLIPNAILVSANKSETCEK